MAHLLNVTGGSFYEILCVEFGATAQEIRSAFKRKALQLHPDKGGTKEGFQSALKAFEILSDPRSRNIYNSRLQAKLARARSGKDCGPGKTDRKNSTAGRAKPSQEFAAAVSEKRQRKKKQTETHEQTPAGKKRTSSSNDDGRSNGLRGQTGQSTGAGTLNKGERILDLIFGKLCALNASRRKTILTEDFSEKQRLALESFMNKSNKSAPPDPQDSSRGQDMENLCCDPHFSSSDSSQGKPLALYDQDCPFSREQNCEDSDTDDSDQQSDENGDSDDVAAMTAGLTDSDVQSCVKALKTRECSERQSHRLRCGSSGIRGITRKVDKNTVYYQAHLNVRCLRIGTKYTFNLPTAVDRLVVLTSMRQRILLGGGCNFEDKVRYAVNSVLKENNLTPNEIGLWYGVSPLKILQGSCATSPSFPIFRNLDKVLAAWGTVAIFRTKGKGGLAIREYVERGLQFDLLWPRMKEAIGDVFEMGGHSRERFAEWLETLPEVVKPLRERCFEQWNRNSMFLEERLQQRVRTLESWNRRVMRREDRNAELVRSHSRRFDRFRRRLRQLLQRWDSSEVSRHTRETNSLKAQMRSDAAKLRLEIAAEAAERHRKWRWMSRPEITMDEIFSARARANTGV